MKPKRKPRATTPRQSALLFKDTWAAISSLDINDPIFDVAHAKSQRDHFNTWHAHLKKDPDIPRATPGAPFTVSDTRQALNSLKSFRRYGSGHIPRTASSRRLLACQGPNSGTQLLPPSFCPPTNLEHMPSHATAQIRAPN